jgi:ABC-2 type transport system permease protein
MKAHRIYALVVRYMYLYRRSLPRMMEIFYWPFLDLVIWGFITVYLMKFQGQIPGVVTFFLGALILWDILFRAQQGVTISFLEEIWARNLMNLFASPLKPSEFLAATMVMSVLKVIAVSVVMVVCAGLFYSYNIFVIGMWLIPFVLNLVMTGWIIGVLTTAPSCGLARRRKSWLGVWCSYSSRSLVYFIRWMCSQAGCRPLLG